MSPRRRRARPAPPAAQAAAAAVDGAPQRGGPQRASVPAVALDGSRGVPVWVHARLHSPDKVITNDDALLAPSRDTTETLRGALAAAGHPWPRGVVELFATPDRPGRSRRVPFGPELELAAAAAVAATDGALRPADVDTDVLLIGAVGITGRVHRVPGVTQLAAAAGEIVVVPTGDLEVCRATAKTHADVGRLRTCGTVGEAIAVLASRDQRWRSAASDIEMDAAQTSYRQQLARAWRHEGHPTAVNGETPMLPADVELAVQAAAAGGHHLLVIGHEDMATAAAHRVAALRPDLEFEAARRTTRLHSAAGVAFPPGGLVNRPPLVELSNLATDHDVRPSARGRPGALSIANGGVLVVKDVARAAPVVLAAAAEAARHGQVRPPCAEGLEPASAVPAAVTMVYGSRSCPCGDEATCMCMPGEIARHSRLALEAPATLRVNCDSTDPQWELARQLRGAARNRVLQATAAAARGDTPNAASEPAEQVLRTALERQQITAGQAQQVREVAATLSALDGNDGEIRTAHVEAALRISHPPEPLFPGVELRTASDQAVETLSTDAAEGVEI